jgi:hypothetical protein
MSRRILSLSHEQLTSFDLDAFVATPPNVLIDLYSLGQNFRR